MQALETSSQGIGVAQAMGILDGWDLSLVRQRLIQFEGYTPEQVDEMEAEYRRYVALSAAHATGRAPLGISAVLDPFWHTHILFTEDYVRMSRALGHPYLHHRPAAPDELDEVAPQYERTLSLYREHFGDPDERLWPADAVICGGPNCACSGTGNE